MEEAWLALDSGFLLLNEELLPLATLLVDVRAELPPPKSFEGAQLQEPSPALPILPPTVSADYRKSLVWVVEKSKKTNQNEGKST